MITNSHSDLKFKSHKIIKNYYLIFKEQQSHLESRSERQGSNGDLAVD